MEKLNETGYRIGSPYVETFNEIETVLSNEFNFRYVHKYFPEKEYIEATAYRFEAYAKNLSDKISGYFRINNPQAKNCTLKNNERRRGYILNSTGSVDLNRCVVMECEAGYRINRFNDSCVKKPEI